MQTTVNQQRTDEAEEVIHTSETGKATDMHESNVGEIEIAKAGKCGGPESRHEGAAAVHAAVIAGAPSVNLGKVLRAALNNAPIPAPVTEQLLREACNGNLDATLAFAELTHCLAPSDEIRVAITAAVIPALEREDPRAMFMMSVMGLSESNSPRVRRRCIRNIRAAASAGVIEAAWWLAFHHDGTSWPEILRRIRAAADAGYSPAIAATKFIRLAAEDAARRTAERLWWTFEASEKLKREAQELVERSSHDHERELSLLKGQIAALQAEVEAQTARAAAAVSTQDDRVKEVEAVRRHAAAAEAATRDLVQARQALAEQARVAKKARVALDEANKRSVAEAFALNSRIAHLEESLRRREARRAGK